LGRKSQVLKSKVGTPGVNYRDHESDIPTMSPRTNGAKLCSPAQREQRPGNTPPD
jgi:hypothetical protein